MARKFIDQGGIEHTVRCSRCRKVCRDMTDWNAVYSAGCVTGFLCPTCQTAEENAEAVVNEATLTYATDRFGRTIARSKA